MAGKSKDDDDGVLRSVEAVIAAVGGTARAAELAGVGMSGVSNWRLRGTIPAEYFFLFEQVLAPAGAVVDRSVFAFKEPAGVQS